MRTPTFWQSRNFTSSLLLPAAALYRLGAACDRLCTTPKRAALPVISIGNVTAGGAGKTPAALALVPLLRAMGHTPHILTRGYGGSHLTAHRVTAGDDWRRVGDEAVLLARAAPTWVGRNRHACALAATQAGATILIADDALQHHALFKTFSLLVIDGPYGVGNGRLIPAGPLREPFAAAIARCDAALIIGEDMHGLKDQLPIPCYDAHFMPSDDHEFLKTGRWLAFAGIGRPDKFFDSLRRLGADIAASIPFADHHPYRAADLENILAQAQRLGAQPITTEKDAVKLPPHFAPLIRTLPVRLALAQQETLCQAIARKLVHEPS